MLSKCLNPSCSRTFRYLHDGQVFQLEIPKRVPGSGRVGKLTECFWLCAQCCATLTIVMKNGTASVEPRYLELPWKETQEDGTENFMSGPWRRATRDR